MFKNGILGVLVKSVGDSGGGFRGGISVGDFAGGFYGSFQLLGFGEN